MYYKWEILVFSSIWEKKFLKGESMERIFFFSPAVENIVCESWNASHLETWLGWVASDHCSSRAHTHSLPLTPWVSASPKRKPRYPLRLALLCSLMTMPLRELSVPGLDRARPSSSPDLREVRPPLTPTGLSWGRSGLTSSQPSALLPASPLSHSVFFHDIV